MLKTQKRLISSIAVFSAIELTLGILVQTTSSTFNTVVSFLSVVIACAFVALAFSKTTTYLFTQIALVCTVFADLFLVVLTPINREAGMVFFALAQICYFLRIYFEQDSKKLKNAHIIARLSAIIVALSATVIVLKDKTDFLSLISLFYYANLITSIVFAFINGKKSLVFAIGLVLFAMCDALIGLSTMADLYISVAEGTLLYSIIHPSFDLAWVFYVPSQALIAISVACDKLKKC